MKKFILFIKHPLVSGIAALIMFVILSHILLEKVKREVDDYKGEKSLIEKVGEELGSAKREYDKALNDSTNNSQ